MNNWTVVIPIYNDWEALDKLIKEINCLEFKNGSFIIVDNGSTDNSMTDLANNKSSKIKYIRSENNLGFGGGIKFGLKFTDTEWVGWMPGNLKVHPKELHKFEEIINLNLHDFIKAYRVGRDIKSKLKTTLAGVVQSFVLKKNMLDTGGTPTFIRKKYVRKLVLAPDDYVFESYVLFTAHKYKLKMTRPKIIYGNRIYGKSHWQRGFKSEVKLMIAIYNCVRRLR